MSDIPTFDQGIVTEDKSSSTSSGSSEPDVVEVAEGVAQMIIDSIQQKGPVVEIPAFDREAIDIPEAYSDHYDFEGAEKLSVESLFGLDLSEYDYIGTPPVTNSDNLSDDELEQLTDDEKFKSDGDLKAYVIKPEFAEAFRDANVKKGGTTPISRGLNGHWADLVTDAFGEDSKISVGKGKKRNHDGDAVEAMTHVAFWVSDSDTAPYQRKKAQYQAGEIDQETFEEWAEANGFEDKL